MWPLCREGIASLQRCKSLLAQGKNKKGATKRIKIQKIATGYPHILIYGTSILHSLEVSTSSQIMHTESRLPPGMKVLINIGPNPLPRSVEVPQLVANNACSMHHETHKKMPKVEVANLCFFFFRLLPLIASSSIIYSYIVIIYIYNWNVPRIRRKSSFLT